MTDDASRELIPPERWIPHPVSDHGDLDRPEPVYGDSLTGDAKAEFDAAVAVREKAAKPPAKRRRPRRRAPRDQQDT
jgi:hypothetical protein